MNCRFCHGALHKFVDLGSSPPCESFLAEGQLSAPETFYPLAAYVCRDCWLVQLPEHVSPHDIFTEYAYFSAFSDAWLDHARRYVDKVTDLFGLDGSSRVVELGSNDGYLLQYFVKKGIPALGVDPAANVVKAAAERGVRTVVGFFGAAVAQRVAAEEGQADLVLGNNVLAQVPDLNDFVAGIAMLLKPDGAVTLEFPHILETLQGNQFDQFYHEHFSYFSGLALEKIFAAHGLRLFDVERLWSHGGSLRVYACHGGNAARPTSGAVKELLAAERAAGLDRLETYEDFAEKVFATKRRLLSFLIEARDNGKTVIGYGAPGKGNTLLNYCGIRTDLLAYTVDRNPHKHGRYLPGTRIPIHPPKAIATSRPDYVLILPWNLRDEIAAQLGYIRDWGGKFVVPIPELTVF